MTLDEITQAVNSGAQLTRAHVKAVLDSYADPDNAYINLQTFLTGITSLTEDEKLMILHDLESYG